MASRRKTPTAGPNGFTFVELMVSLAIMGMLLSLAIPTATKYRKMARRIECQASVLNFLRAQDLYYLENGTFYTKGKVNRSYKIAWNRKKRPDKKRDRYQFPELGVEFRPDSHRGYRITVWDRRTGRIFYQELRFELNTDEDFDASKLDPETFTYRKYNVQVTTGRGSWGTNGTWVKWSDFWFPVPSAL